MPVSTGALYGRRAKLTILIPSKAKDDYHDTIATQLVIAGEGDPTTPGLRIQFKVTKTTEKEPNTSEIIVTNLSETTRKALQTKGVKVRLEAGYASAGLVTIFEGDVRTVDHIRDKADWNTHLKLGDGERWYRYARVHYTFPGGTTAAQVLNTIAQQSGIGVGNVPQAAAAGLASKVYNQGYVVSGSASQAIDKLLKALKHDGSTRWGWSVQDGALQILAPGQALTANVPLISPSTGLIGSPEMGTPEKQGQPALCHFKSLLQQVQCGGTVHLTSERYDTDVTVKKLEYEGDTHGGAWFVVIFGILKNSKGTTS